MNQKSKGRYTEGFMGKREGLKLCNYFIFSKIKEITQKNKRNQ